MLIRPTVEVALVVMALRIVGELAQQLLMLEEVAVDQDSMGRVVLMEAPAAAVVVGRPRRPQAFPAEADTIPAAAVVTTPAVAVTIPGADFRRPTKILA